MSLGFGEGVCDSAQGTICASLYGSGDCTGSKPASGRCGDGTEDGVGDVLLVLLTGRCVLLHGSELRYIIS